MTGWLEPVHEALDRVPARVEIFFRDDDAGWRDDRLRSLIDLFARHELPLDLAVIPAELTPRLARELRARTANERVGLHQHGFAHRNHEHEEGKARGHDEEVGDQGQVEKPEEALQPHRHDAHRIQEVDCAIEEPNVPLRDALLQERDEESEHVREVTPHPSDPLAQCDADARRLLVVDDRVVAPDGEDALLREQTHHLEVLRDARHGPSEIAKDILGTGKKLLSAGSPEEALSFAIDAGKSLESLSLEELRGFASEFNQDFYQCLTLDAVLASHDVAGGTAPARVEQALQEAHERLAVLRSELRPGP